MTNTPDVVDELARIVHDRLLTEGGKGLRSAVWLAYTTGHQAGYEKALKERRKPNESVRAR